ncbi:MAG: hypothetical protein OEU54_00435 [Gemmatimonadota bacterium]|nr:hypothetical protein [Gemmatimonadota bacterium]
MSDRRIARPLLTRRELSFRQRLDYLELGLRAEVGLEEAIRLLSPRDSHEADPSHLERLYRSVRRLDGAWLTVHADLTSFISGDLKVRPPARCVSRRVDERTALLSSMPGDVLPSVVLTLAGDIIDRWASTRPCGGLEEERGAAERHRSGLDAREM